MELSGMIIWRGALPRTGGTVCLKIAEYILQINGVNYKPVTRDEIFSGFDLKLSPERFEEALIGGDDSFFSEAFLNEPFRILYVKRDLRDAFTSFIKLTKINFDTAVKGIYIESWIKRNMNFLALPSERCLKLNYEEDVLSLPNACRKIAHFLSLEVSEADVDEINSIFSKQAIKKHIDAEIQRFLNDPDISGESGNDTLQFLLEFQEDTKLISIPMRLCTALESGTNVRGELLNFGPFELAKNLNESWRLKFNTIINDSQTDGFQQGHVSSESTRPWKTFFSNEQKELIHLKIQRTLKTVPTLPPTIMKDLFSNDDPSTWRQISRNTPCPCNSGNKYKHCHGEII